MSVKVEIVWTKDKLMGALFGGESRQTKTFASETDAMQWIRMHSNNIAEINGKSFRAVQGLINHYDIMGALRESERR